MKERLDVLLTARGLAGSREKAKALIMAGQVYVDGQKEDKAGTMFRQEAVIEIRGNTLPYVSTRYLRVEGHAGISAGSERKDLHGRGSVHRRFYGLYAAERSKESLLRRCGTRAAGLGLRNDPRVVCMEKTNIRYLTPDQIQEKPSFVSIDVSFISLTKVLGPVRELMEEQGQIVSLIKPQFEAGREKVGKKGVVRDPAVHREVIEKVMDFARSLQLTVRGLDFSPVKGPEGNIEYLLWIEKGWNTEEAPAVISPEETVKQAHKALD